jgi:thiol:disulfide interchange protein DsbA
MRILRLALVAASLFTSVARASPSVPKDGLEYLTLGTPQATANSGKKVEVIEFFYYHCPFCNAFEPDLERWVKKQGNNITFRRIEAAHTGPNDPEAHLFLTLEAMGKAEEMQAKVFKAFHVDRIRLNREDAIVDWVSKNGIDRKKFLDTWNSFGVTTKLNRLAQVLNNYQIRSVPTIVIDGKYQTSPAMAQTAIGTGNTPQVFTATLQIMDALVEKAAAAK